MSIGDTYRQAQEVADALLVSALGEDRLTPRERAVLADLRRRSAEHAVWRDEEMVKHLRVMESATGHRRQILEMHGPVLSYEKLTCEACGNDCCGGVCDSTRHPCETYSMALGWEAS